MSTELGPLYHWSPRERLKSITRLGLVPGKRNVIGPVFHHDGLTEDAPHYAEAKAAGEFRQSGVCFSTTPATAWAYSHGAWHTEGTFDLWEVYLEQNDEVHVLPPWGGRIVEVRVHNRIKKSRLVWVGERSNHE